MRSVRWTKTARALSFLLVTSVGAFAIYFGFRHASTFTTLLPSVTWLNRGNYVTALQMVTRPGVDGSTTILPSAAPDEPTLVIEATGEQLQMLNLGALRRKHDGHIRICILNPYADPA